MKEKILFLCTGNSCRSQMAEAFGRELLGDSYEFYSAGTQKHGLNPRAMEVMQELGIDMSHHKSKTLDDLSPDTFDIVITVCSDAYENCPYFPGKKRVHIGFDDPPRMTEGMENENEIMDIYRRVRDEIKAVILKLDEYLKEAK